MASNCIVTSMRPVKSETLLKYLYTFLNFYIFDQDYIVDVEGYEKCSCTPFSLCVKHWATMPTVDSSANSTMTCILRKGWFLSLVCTIPFNTSLPVYSMNWQHWNSVAKEGIWLRSWSNLELTTCFWVVESLTLPSSMGPTDKKPLHHPQACL